MARVRQSIFLALGLLLGALVVPAAAAPVPAGQVVTNNSFSQLNWINSNPDNPWGLFDAIALEFVSQSPAQAGFKNVNIKPNNGWVSGPFDPHVTFGYGAVGSAVAFDLTFEGNVTDQVSWTIWYYRDGQALGGSRYDGFGSYFQPFTFTLLDAADAPTVPEPAAMALLVPAALALLRRRRRA